MFPRPSVCLRRRGVALVIVLAFVVLLTGLVVAFLSRAIFERQISDSSASETKVDFFAGGAVTTLIGDLRQEIAAGSNAATLAGGGTVYTPKVPATAVPAIVGFAPVYNPPGVETDGLNNLVKRSANGQPFYPAANYDANAPSRAAAVSTLLPSKNGRAISPARWNKPLLIAKSNLGDDTDFTPTTSYKPPDWIVVARDGTNPIAWNTALVNNGGNPAIGRFAYNVYDEGGLLDANAVGFPSAAGAVVVPLSDSPANLPGYKASIAFADLKQLPGISALTPDSRPEEVVRTLVGWRNYASSGIDVTQAIPTAGSPVSGSVNVAPGYLWTGPGAGTNVFNYLNFAQLDPTGFLRTSNPVVVNGQSDRFFASRQALMNLLLNSVANQASGATAKNERASLQNAMQYLGTFSRGLSQPSFAPPAGRPTVQPLASGGNYEGPGNDNTINPSFLTVRVLTTIAGGRNDGTDLVQGEPLVKKRFSLNHLAWITYKGPSQGRTSTDPDITDLETHFGFTQAYLNLGTLARIQQYFGLTWNSAGFWTYDIHASATGIKTLAQVQADNREPDFVELLKAAITAGALGKSGAQSAGPGDASALAVQFTRDSSIDFQVIQLTANIIDQFDVDGFPTRIQFLAREFRGVENLPYLYRVRNGLYRIVDPTPMPTDTNADWSPSTTITNPGAFIMVQQPEIWNPHAYDATSAATMNRSLGNPRPQNLQMVVYGGRPALPPLVPGTSGSSAVFSQWRNSPSGPAYASSPLSASTTKMTFANGDALYREPTLLIKPNVPAGSNLQAPGLVTAANSDGLSAYTTSTGINVLNSSAIAYGGAEPSPGVYCGIYLGTNVVAHAGDNGGTNGQGPYIQGTRFAGQAHLSLPTAMTYQILCDSPFGTGMAIYDEKYFSDDQYTDDLPYNRGMLSVSTSDVNTYSGRLIIGVNRMMTGFDPRTSRFGMLNSPTGDNNNFQDQEFAVPGIQSPGAPKWVDQANDVVSSNRLDSTAGFGMGSGSSYGGTPVNGPAAGSFGWTWNGLLRFGLFSQNNPAGANDDLRFIGDTNVHNMGSPAAQYYADADGVVRRAMAAYVPAGTGTPAASANTTTGLPMATAYYAPISSRQVESRPIILNRPFRTVGELGYVFSDTPWKNLDLSTPESGYAALLDVFCTNDTDDPVGMVAGRADLNTRQIPVLQAILNGAYKDEYNGAAAPLSSTEANTLATALVARTTSTATGKGPLTSVADLVGGWRSGSGTAAVYSGYSADLNSADVATNNISRYRESAVRALAAAGNTRVWNLMIDVVAQTGRYPAGVNSLDQFVVDGEQRYWVHVAIDRYTGQVIDKQVEVVKE